MNTPICDFVRSYADSRQLRLHMPGHKGASFLGMEHLDITEIDGADSLYEADGIIAQSEANASQLFGCKTLYSTEGSSQCIRAMLYLVLAFALPYGTVQQHGEEEEPFAGFGQPTGGPADYTPEAPPFDISEAQDVEIDGQE